MTGKKITVRILGWALLLGGWMSGSPAHGDAGPLQTLVVVNDQDAASLELGLLYANSRGIPQRNICHLSTPVANDLSTASFTNDVVNPILSHLTDQGLDGQIDWFVFCWYRPYRVQLAGENINSLTSAMFYGFTDAPPPPPCELNDDGKNPLYASEKSFHHSEAPGLSRLYPSALLTGPDLDFSKSLVSRSVLADASFPEGNVHLLRSSDTARNVHWPQFENSVFRARQVHMDDSWQQAEANSLSGETNIVGYMVGSVSLLGDLFTNTFLPGAIGHHLTSLGGRYHNPAGQMSVLNWIKAGCAGTYGTVVEPCNYTNKYPQAALHNRYSEGFSLGDPLCRPFAEPPGLSLLFPTNGFPVANTFTASVEITQSDTNAWVDQLRWYLDGVQQSILWEEGPEPGNQVTATLNGVPYTYTVLPGNNLEDVIAGLAALMTPTGFEVIPYPDMLEIRQTNLGSPGAGIGLSVATSSGIAAEKGIHAWAEDPNLVETLFPARQNFYIQGSPSLSDNVAIRITKSNGTQVNRTYSPNAGETRLAFVQRMISEINSDASLNGADGVVGKYITDFGASNVTEAYLEARSPGWDSANLRLRVQVSGGSFIPSLQNSFFRSNQEVMGARGLIRFTSGRSRATLAPILNLSGQADGPHRITFECREGRARRTLTRGIVEVVRRSHPTECLLAYPVEGSLVVQGQVVTALVSAVTVGADIVSTNLWVEGKPAAGLIWDSAASGVGEVTFQAGVLDNLGRDAVTQEVRVQVLADIDHDGLADVWELAHYPALNTVNASSDTDLDGQTSLQEFVADTSPTNSLSLLQIKVDRLPDRVRIRFPSSSQRRYQIEQRQGNATQVWATVVADLIGNDGEMVWEDDGGTLPPPTNGYRTFRVRARLP